MPGTEWIFTTFIYNQTHKVPRLLLSQMKHRETSGEHLRNAKCLEEHGRATFPDAVEISGRHAESDGTVLGDRNTEIPIVASTRQLPQLSSAGMPSRDTVQQSYSQTLRSTPRNDIQAASCGMILSTIGFPFDQLTVLEILLPNLPNQMSWNDSNHILCSFGVEWCRLKALKALISKLPTVPTAYEKDQLLANFTSSYYRDKMASLLDDWLDRIPESADTAETSST